MEPLKSFLKTRLWALPDFHLIFLFLFFQCMPHSWFIPCDLHFFILAIPLVMILVKFKKIGVSLMFALILGTAIIPGIITYEYKLEPLVVFYQE